MNTVLTDRLREVALPLVCAILLSLAVVATGGWMPLLLIAVMAVALLVYAVARDARIGFWLLLGLNFLSVGLTRYLPLPLGLAVDFMLTALLVLQFLTKFRKLDWTPLRHPVFLITALWMIINLLEIFNPEACSIEAWFYAMRGVALYMFLTLLVSFLFLEYKRDFNWFIGIWFFFSVLGTLWGMKQLILGLDAGEKAWLNVPGNLTTHLLFGKLRVFSFYSDAGQFGASQAHTGLVAALLSLSAKSRMRKAVYIGVALLSFYGMLISGTRGALAIPVAGMLAFLLMIRNFRLILVSSIVAGTLFCLLKFTYVGQGVYEIRRLRTSLNPDDPSLQVRIANQKRLAHYLDTHWLGGGVGSAGYWGQRFSPDTFLANLALDSWYVRIAAEYGYPGILFYLILIGVICTHAVRSIRREEDQQQRMQKIALFCGLIGILAASYGNQVLGQMPTGILIYLSIAFLSIKNNLKQSIDANATS